MMRSQNPPAMYRQQIYLAESSLGYHKIGISKHAGKRIQQLSIPGVLETDVEPIKNPVTGAPHRIQVVMPEGFEHITGEVASANIHSTGAIPFETSGSHSTLAHVVQTPRGVEA